MKIKNNLLTALISGLMATTAFAQPTANTAPTLVPAKPVELGSVTQPMQISSGNAYEREVTPLLREISKKKSVLELRKLDREIEKLDEDALKAQSERDKGSNNSANSITPYNPMPREAPVMNMSGPISADLQVFMIYGYDDNLYAKIGTGSQGGYVVKKGDILPDGRIVANVTPNFIEVKKGKAKKGLERIFVSAKPEPQQNATNPSNNASSAMPQVIPSAPPSIVAFPTTGMIAPTSAIKN